jgi:hypothetical protein
MGKLTIWTCPVCRKRYRSTNGGRDLDGYSDVCDACLDEALEKPIKHKFNGLNALFSRVERNMVAEKLQIGGKIG